MDDVTGSTTRPTLCEMENDRPHPGRLNKADYHEQLRLLQIEMLKVQHWAKESGEKLVVLFEGRDAAGKGGAIRRFAQNLNPRGARVVALSKPNDTERGQWYFQRYIQHLPTDGEIVLFDRPWYNRAGVEIVMGFCTGQEYGEFLRQVTGFERCLVESRIHLYKLWFTVSKKEQAKRFESRRRDPLRRWKLSPMDEAAQSRWEEYTRARDAMLVQSDSDIAPWTIVNSNEKRRARLESIRHVLHSLDYDHKDDSVAHAPDPRVVQRGLDVIESSPLVADPVC